MMARPDTDELAAWFSDADHFDPRVLALLAWVAELERTVAKLSAAGRARDDDSETSKEAQKAHREGWMLGPFDMSR